MRPAICFVLSSVVVSACSSITPDLEGARQVVPALAAAFSACDLGKMASLYSETAEFVAPDTPEPIIGRVAVTRHLSGACTAMYQPILSVLEQRVHPLGSNAAVVSGTYSFGRTDRPNDARWSASFVITLMRSSGGWLIQSQATFAASK